MHPNPLADAPPTDAEDVELARLAQSGSKDALESLVMRHPAFVAMSPESLTRRVDVVTPNTDRRSSRWS